MIYDVLFKHENSFLCLRLCSCCC